MKLNKYFLLVGLASLSLSTFNSCKKEDFSDYYTDPGKIDESIIEKQFTGITYAYRELIMPSYWNYFVILRSTANRYIQATGWANETNQLTPGGASIQDRWSTYYSGLAQFREFEKLYAVQSEEDKANKTIFYQAAKILFYNQTHQVVDLHGDIPWTEAGKLSSNGGDYAVSYAKYDKAQDIYKTMLDDLKVIADWFETAKISQPVEQSFKTQDIINNGDILAWRKYCNSLRLRLLMRVSNNPEFSGRATQEVNEIINNPSKYPLVLTNDDNIKIDVFNPASDINSNGFRDGIESWNANIAGKVMIDHMVGKADPRLPFIFEPGAGAGTTFTGLDQSLTSAVQTTQIAGTPANPSKIAIYNRSTYSRNTKFPGFLFTASEIQFLIAEYYLKINNPAAAKTAFEKGIRESIALYPMIRALSPDNTTAAATAPTATAINTYLTNLGWGTNNLQLVATQKWLHFNIVQPLESWSEIRRLDYPKFSFNVEPSDLQKTVPLRWLYPASEVNFNETNYETVMSNDKLDTKIFWDIN
ncbi:SusD/RagB family nutrient-binding outer membrane lipoprotein [Sphingobacterium daejeonense]|uniref:SusD/RagB family nutrient-binding outer membrane lipoprotein n=1 Tax=Sphingobacterium daejeonense TaxID=371142 RepID=UPI003D316853